MHDNALFSNPRRKVCELTDKVFRLHYVSFGGKDWSLNRLTGNMLGVIIFTILGSLIGGDYAPCPHYKHGLTLDVESLVGTWLTIYTQPKTMDCFSLHIRATTDLEREQCVMKFGNLSALVDWNQCFLEVLSPLGKHLLQGNGSECGILENIVIVENIKGEYSLQEQRPNQWILFGRRGEEVLIMRDLEGSAAAAFARAPFWPTTSHLHAILHRGGVVCVAKNHVLCQPEQFYLPMA